MKTLQNEKNIDRLKELINLTGKEVFTYKYIEQLAELNGYHDMTFYFMLYAGCFDKIKRGLYKKNVLLNQLTGKEIFKRATDALEKNKESKKLILSNTIKDENIVIPNMLTEEECIKYLKQLGYKIMKPVQEYKEV